MFVAALISFGIQSHLIRHHQVLYGVPVGPSMLPTVDSLDKTVTMRLLIDHIDHVSLLSNYARLPENANKPWSIFIKLDNGSRRAGVPPDSPALGELVRAVEANPKIQLHGFYAYTSTSYASRTLEDAEKYLQEQINAVFSATSLVKDPSQPLVLSIGSSPTARVLRPIREKVPSNITFEIHAGNLRFLFLLFFPGAKAHSSW
jgi:D-serine deaminase-like pyridoxal phosphate-dependent protein